MSQKAQFVIGIDLGTTNTVLAFAPLDAEPVDVQLMSIPQVVRPNEVESRVSLPSFLYLPRDQEAEGLAWDLEDPLSTGVAGIYARDQAAENPQRVVVAAKSWLCHSRVGRTDAVLPWQAPDEVPKVSALECTKRFLQHIAAAWQAEHPEASFADQQVVLTVPASFDPVARELTREAALAVGFPDDFVLLEEPQAAVYHWLSQQGEAWREELKADDSILVVDVGGGTTDLTLVTVAEESGQVVLERTAIGNHLLIGGDNMDLALAHHAAGQLDQQGHSLDPWQSVSLWHACRDAKETLLAGEGPETQTLSVLGRGSSLIGGTVSTDLQRDEVERLVLDGFFPECSRSDRPEHRVASGFQDIGLPYESDPAITKQIAAFLADHGQDTTLTHLLFNGGVLRSDTLRGRLTEVIRSWCEDGSVKELGGVAELDTAVAKGAAYYGWTKQRGGVRIRGGTARSYYIGIETSGLAIPGAPRPLRALCVAAQGMEEGTDADVPSDAVGLVVGAPAEFRFFSSTVRPQDSTGVQLDRWSPDELTESDPMELHLTAESAGEDPFVPVRFHACVTELGMFELWCHATRGEDRWKMEFNVRDDHK